MTLDQAKQKHGAAICLPVNYCHGGSELALHLHSFSLAVCPPPATMKVHPDLKKGKHRHVSPLSALPLTQHNSEGSQRATRAGLRRHAGVQAGSSSGGESQVHAGNGGPA